MSSQQLPTSKLVSIAAVVVILVVAGVFTYYRFFSPPAIAPSPVPPQTELVTATSFRCNDVDLLKEGIPVVAPSSPLRLAASFRVLDRKRFADISETNWLVRIRIEDQRGVIYQSGLAMAKQEGDSISMQTDEVTAPSKPGEYTIRLIAAKFRTRDGNDDLASRLLCEGKLRVEKQGADES